MVYELVLTEQCTRKCKFCWVQQSNCIESLDNIQRFVAQVKNSPDSEFKISLFGGEPLLNLSGIRLVVDSFSRDPRCSSIILTTNADLIQTVLDESWIKDVEWQVSAYDIFSDKERYQSILRKLPPTAMIQYTFTEDDINLVKDFQQIAKKHFSQTRYRTVFSHSRSSWKHIDSSQLYQMVFDAIASELSLTLDEFPKIRCCSISKPLRAVVGKCLLGGYHFSSSKRPCCLDYGEDDTCQKQVFYHGRFIGPCLSTRDIAPDKRCIVSIDPKCKSCCYDSICTRSCFSELLDGQTVDEKLCAVERGQLDAVCQFARDHQYSRVWREIVRKVEHGEI